MRLVRQHQGGFTSSAAAADGGAVTIAVDVFELPVMRQNRADQALEAGMKPLEEVCHAVSPLHPGPHVHGRNRSSADEARSPFGKQQVLEILIDINFASLSAHSALSIRQAPNPQGISIGDADIPAIFH